MNFKLKAFSSFVLGLATLSLAQPAKAVIYDWQFTNEDGNFGANTDVVAGFVEFSDADVSPNALGVAAIDLQITSVTDLDSSSAPFFGDGGIELDTNLSLDSVSSNSGNFDDNGLLNQYSFQKLIFDGAGNREIIQLFSSTSSLVDEGQTDGIQEEFFDGDASTLIFTQQSASVPFEFSPSMGLFFIGGMLGLKRYANKRQASKLANRNYQ